jgi:hypothetical protein
MAGIEESGWVGIPQQIFVEWALSDSIPLPTWQRLQYLALGRCDATGIAVFRKGELAKLIYGGPDKHRNLKHGINIAVNYGVLDPESCRSFLRVPEQVLRSAPPGGRYRRRVA